MATARLEGVQSFERDREQFACGRRERQVALLGDGERVVERILERSGVKAGRKVATVDGSLGDDRVADTGRRESQRAGEVLDLDARRETTADPLQALVKLPAGGVAVAVVGVVENQRPRSVSS